MSQSDHLKMLALERRVADLEQVVRELQETKADRAGRKPSEKAA